MMAKKKLPAKLPRIQSIGRGFDVLFAIAASERGLRVREIFEQLGLDRQTTYHILQSLASVGVVAKTAENRYVLGLRVGDLIESFGRQLAPAERLTPLVRALVQATGESSYAVGWVRGEIVALSAVPGTKSVSAVEVPQGYASNAHARASGKLLLALADPDFARAYLDTHPLKKLTENTITKRSVLEKQFAEIRKQRFAIERGEFAPSLCCIATPVGKAGGRYALALSVPSERFEANLDHYKAALLRIAHDYSA